MRLSPEEVSRAAQIACLLEVSAAKPGNVNRFHDFSDTRYEDFLISAVAIGRAIREAKALSVGSIVLKAIRDTRRYVSSNTNLGMVLLFAPLAKAAVGNGKLREELHAVLSTLTVQDTRKVYQAIRLANPGGLGEAEQYDVREKKVAVTLLEAMRAAKDRDAVAREYTTDFEITFSIGCPMLKTSIEASDDLEGSIIQTFLTILSEVPDTLIARKNGEEVARRISDQAREILKVGGAFSEAGKMALEGWDRELRKEGNRLNPGTTADLVAASIFVKLLEDGPDFLIALRPPSMLFLKKRRSWRGSSGQSR
ncbi:MAG: triphosphoribosyl-dephospho-CoA synthase [Candidatus Methylomirabilales bacterium]